MRSLRRAGRRLGSLLAVVLLASCSHVERSDVLAAPDRPLDPTALTDLSVGHLAIEPLRVTVSGHSIPAYYAPADHPRGTVIVIGDVGNDADALLREAVQRTRRLDLDLVTFSYYIDAGAPPNVAEIRAASRAVYDAVMKRGTPPGRSIYLMGQGFGAWFALDLAEQVPVKALALASIGTTVAETYGQHYFPVNLSVGYGDDEDLAELDAVKAARALTVPTICLTSSADDQIAPALTKRVFGAMPFDTAKQLVMLDGVTHDAYLANDQFWDDVAVFLRRH